MMNQSVFLLQNFFFGIALLDRNYIPLTIELNQYFDISIKYSIQKGNTINSTNIGTRNCNYQDFYPNKTKIEESYFNNYLKGNNWICPYLKGLDINIKGDLNTDVATFFEISVEINRDYYDQIDLISKIFQDKGITAAFQYIDTYIDYDSLSDPVLSSINYDPTILDLRTNKQVMLYFSRLEFSSDENILYNHPTSINDLILDQRSFDFYTNDVSIISNINRLNLLTYWVQGGQNKWIYQRSYQKLTSFLADMTGILSQIFLILIVIFSYVNEKAASQKIMQRLMKFKGQKNYNIQLFLDVFKEKCKQSKNLIVEKEKTNFKKFSRLKLQDDNNNDMTIYQYNSNQKNIKNNTKVVNNRKETLVENYTKLKTNIKSDRSEYTFSKMSSCEILCSVICCCNRKWKINNEIITKGEEKICFYLDVLTYIKKMNELSVLKYILLTTNQYNLFSFLSSPTILFQDVKSEVNINLEEEMRRNLIIDKENIEKMNNSYDSILSKDEFTPIDSKLIKLFNSEIEIFND